VKRRGGVYIGYMTEQMEESIGAKRSVAGLCLAERWGMGQSPIKHETKKTSQRGSAVAQGAPTLHLPQP
jgi:hypothetical protein